MDTSLPILAAIRVASPCSAAWGDMAGDHRVRHCDQCDLNVYNLSEMTAHEIVELIREKEGRLCGRLFRRADGTIITGDCPIGLAGLRKRITGIALRVAAAALAVVGIPAIILPQWTMGSMEAPESSTHSMLQTIWSQIELFNVQNPGSPFDVALGWRQLIEGNYLMMEPRNPLAKSRSAISAVPGPDPGAGWAWVADRSGNPATVTVRPRDEAGNVLYEDANGNVY